MVLSNQHFYLKLMPFTWICFVNDLATFQSEFTILIVNMSDTEPFLSELIRSMLYISIQNDIKSEDFEVKIESLSKSKLKETEFKSHIYRIFFEKGSESETANSSLILKMIPQNIENHDRFHSRSHFLNEIHIYDEVSENSSKNLVNLLKSEQFSSKYFRF